MACKLTQLLRVWGADVGVGGAGELWLPLEMWVEILRFCCFTDSP